MTEAASQRRVVLLDGGMGQELVRRHRGRPTPLWSARVMLEAPELVHQVHLDNIRAGARVIIANAYAATQCRLEKNGLLERFEELQRLACELALRARDDSGEDVAIAGCLSPLDWSYRPDLMRGVDDMLTRYGAATRIQAPFVDLMLCETMSAAGEGKAAATAAQEAGKPVWVAWSVSDDADARLRSGEGVDEAVSALDGLSIDAMLLNCSTPEAITAALPTLAAAGCRFGAYANGFTRISADFAPETTVEKLSVREDFGPDAYAEAALDWVELGASIVGGCCEVGPAHIAAVRSRLSAAGCAIVGAFDG